MSVRVFIGGIIAAGLLMAADARADAGLAPRIGLGAEIDSNYAYRGTDEVAAAGAGGEAGLTLLWMPSLRHRLYWDTGGGFDALQPIADPAPARESASLVQTRLGWSYLTSLRTRFDVALGAFRYVAPQVFDRRVTYGGDGALGLTVRVADALEAGIGGFGGIDADEPAAPDARTDTGFNGRLWARWMPHWRFALDVRGTAGQTASDDGDFGFAAMGGGGGLELRPWRSGTFSLRAGWRQRRYPARTDRRIDAGAAFAQRLGDSNRIELSTAYIDNQSVVFPYQKSTARVQWVFEPEFWF